MENIEFKMLSKVENIYGDNIGNVELWDSSVANISHNLRAEVVAKISTLSYGNADSKYPMNLYKRLIKMGHLSTLEFVRNNSGYTLGDSLRNKSFRPWNETLMLSQCVDEAKKLSENVLYIQSEMSFVYSLTIPKTPSFFIP